MAISNSISGIGGIAIIGGLTSYSSVTFLIWSISLSTYFSSTGKIILIAPIKLSQCHRTDLNKTFLPKPMTQGERGPPKESKSQ